MRMRTQAHAYGRNVQEKFHLTGRLGQDLPLGQRRLMIEGIIGLLWGTGSDRTLTFRHNQTNPPRPQAQSVRVLPPPCVELKALSKGRSVGEGLWTWRCCTIAAVPDAQFMLHYIIANVTFSTDFRQMNCRFTREILGNR